MDHTNAKPDQIYKDVAEIQDMLVANAQHLPEVKLSLSDFQVLIPNERKIL